MIDRLTHEFLRDVSGVIHIGASRGQEGAIYEKNDLDVVWVEPIPEVFEILEKNIKSHPKHQAFQYLVTNIDDKKYKFRISNNKGESSSILDFKMSKELWPEIRYTRTIILKGITLPTLCKREQIDVSKYNALVVDVQGAELLVLEGALPILDNFKYIKVEVADFESYKKCCQIGDMEDFMKEYGYSEIARHKHWLRMWKYHYYDIVYKKDEKL